MPMVSVLVYSFMEFYKSIVGNRPKLRALIPLNSMFLGALIGTMLYFFIPNIVLMPDIGTAIIFGAISGLGATGCHQAIKQVSKNLHHVDKD